MLTVTLKGCASNFTLPKPWLRTTLPTSLFTTALDDPDVSVLNLEHPDITPEVMTLLVDLADGKTPQQHEPKLLTAHRYINLESLLCYAHPLYTKWLHAPAGPLRTACRYQCVREDNLELWLHICKYDGPTTQRDVNVAASGAATRIMRYLLATTSYTDIPISPALRDGKLEFVSMLLASNQFSWNLDDVLVAIEMNFLPVARLVLDDGYKCAAALRHAAKLGRVELVQLYISVEHSLSEYYSKYHINERVWLPCGDNALILAIKHDHLEVVRALVAHPRIDVNATAYTPGMKEYRPFELAVERGLLEMVKLLLEQPKTEIKPDELKSAIDVAANNGYADIVECLLQYKN